MDKDRTPDHNSIVAKSNDLICQMAKFELSELRLIAYCLAHYDSRKEENRSFTARVADLAELFPMDKKSAYSVVRQTVMALGKKPLEFKEGTKRHYWNWFSGFTYDESNGEFEFRITPEIRPYLLKLEGSFTRYRLGDVYQFRAASTWKLYELLKQWMKRGKWEVDLDELRVMLNVGGKYPRWNSLKQWVIDPACKEINAKSDATVDYEQIKKGRRVVGLKFSVRQKISEFLEEMSDDQKKLKKIMRSADICSSKVIWQILDKAEEQGRTEEMLTLVPKMIINANKRNANTAQYVTGAIMAELAMQSQDENDEQENLFRSKALECLNGLTQKGEECQIRAGYSDPEKPVCRVCVAEIPVDEFGVDGLMNFPL